MAKTLMTQANLLFVAITDDYSARGKVRMEEAKKVNDINRISKIFSREMYKAMGYDSFEAELHVFADTCIAAVKEAARAGYNLGRQSIRAIQNSVAYLKRKILGEQKELHKNVDKIMDGIMGVENNQTQQTKDKLLG